MSAPRFLIDSKLPVFSPTASREAVRVELPKNEAHHLREVLRLAPGDLIEVFSKADNRGALAKITTLTPTQCIIEVLSPLASEELPRVTLLIALLKPAKTDFVCEKVTELGVSDIHFFIAERTQNPPKANALGQRLARLTRVRDAALKQSRSPQLTRLAVHSSLEDALSAVHRERVKTELSTEVRIVCGAPEDRGSRYAPGIFDFYPSEVFSRPALEKSRISVESYIAVGPEGGFNSRELDLAAAYDYRLGSLGRTTLRSETAALLACGLAMLIDSV